MSSLSVGVLPFVPHFPGGVFFAVRCTVQTFAKLVPGICVFVRFRAFLCIFMRFYAFSRVFTRFQDSPARSQCLSVWVWILV